MSFVPIPPVIDEQLIQTVWGNTVADDLAYLNSKLGVPTGSGTTAQRPATGSPGQLWYDTTLKRQWQWDGTAWQLIAGAMPTVRLQRSTNLALATGVITTTWDGEIVDTDNMHAAGAGAIVVPIAGNWLFGYTAGLAAATAMDRNVWLDVAGERYAESASNIGASAIYRPNGSSLIRLTAGQSVTVNLYTAAAATLDTQSRFWGLYMGPV